MNLIDSLRRATTGPIKPIAPAPKPATQSSSATAMPTDFFTLSGLVPSTVAPLPPFRYAEVTLPDVSRAGQPGQLTGAQANAHITEAYHQLDQAVSAYLGEPAVANWLTFGKYASREAGVQIADLEATLGAAELDPGAIKNMVTSLADVDRITQGAKAVKAGFKGFQAKLAGGEDQGLVAQLGFPGYMTGQLTKLHDSLVAGNVGVYSHIGPAFDTFLKTEARGQNGAAALQKQGYGKAPLDPQGFVLLAFKEYQKARQLREQAASPDLSSEARLELLAKRQNAIGRGNLLMVANEQWTIVQGPDVFGDPDIARLTQAMEGTMTIVDALGEHRLLPDGGNWTDFATRMGFTEVKRGTAPEAFPIRDDQGRLRHYAPKRYEQREGTIYSYFEYNLSEERSRTMIHTAPQAVPGVHLPADAGR